MITLFSDWHFGNAMERIGGGGSSRVSTDYVIDFKGNLEKEGFKVDLEALQHVDLYSDYSIVTVGATTHETEAHDREEINIRNIEIETILRLYNAGEKVIVIIYAGSAVDVSPFVDKVSAIIYAGFGGEGVNEALAKIISGKICPSGKLTETFFDSKDIPVVFSERTFGLSNFYAERHNFGYRYCDKFDVKPRYAFGFGLSYACFEYSNLEVIKKGETEYEINYMITNTSDIDAKEISQVYVGDLHCTSSRPVKELKAFSKDLISAHQSKRITVILNKDAFSFYNPSMKDWYVENGKFKISVGSSPNDIKLEEVIDIQLPKYTQCSRTHSRKY
jgi:beta-glucosidase